MSKHEGMTKLECSETALTNSEIVPNWHPLRQFRDSDLFRYSSFGFRALSYGFHKPLLRIQIRDVSTSLDMTKVCPLVVKT